MSPAKHATPRTRKPAPEPDTSPPLHPCRIVGIDFSLTSTGVAILHRHDYPDSGPDFRTSIQTIAYTTKVPNDAPLQQRLDRIKAIVQPFYNTILGSCDLVAIEAPAHSAVGGHAWDRAHGWWGIVSLALDLCTAVVVINPSTRAAWATGNGRADKAAVAAAMTRRLPDITFNNSDEADAAALAYMAAQRLGWRPVATKNEQERLDVIRWPKGVHA